MPKVKGLQYGKVIVPADIAVPVDCYLSPFDHRVYQSEREYVKHLRLTRDRIRTGIHQKNHQKNLEKFWHLGSFTEVIEHFNSNPQFVWTNLISHNNWRTRECRYDSPMPQGTEFKITYLKLKHKDSVSNTHNAPHNGYTNWCGNSFTKEGLPIPRGYPGWEGTIELAERVGTKGHFNFGSDMCKGLRIQTGSGGGGSETNGWAEFRYTVIFFEADWPEITRAYREELTFALISDRMPLDSSFVFGESQDSIRERRRREGLARAGGID